MKTKLILVTLFATIQSCKQGSEKSDTLRVRTESPTSTGDNYYFLDATKAHLCRIPCTSNSYDCPIGKISSLITTEMNSNNELDLNSLKGLMKLVDDKNDPIAGQALDAFSVEFKNVLTKINAIFDHEVHVDKATCSDAWTKITESRTGGNRSSNSETSKTFLAIGSTEQECITSAAKKEKTAYESIGIILIIDCSEGSPGHTIDNGYRFRINETKGNVIIDRSFRSSGECLAEFAAAKMTSMNSAGYSLTNSPCASKGSEWTGEFILKKN